ncbi:MAG: aspartate--tRNA ligase [Bdellovibrionales bacterium]
MAEKQGWKRDQYCGKVNAEYAGKDIWITGWCDTRRDHGGLVFIDLRDREGLVQVVFDPAKIPAAKDLRSEFVLAVKGKVNLRPEGMINKKIPTGEVEIEALELVVLSEAQTPPFVIGDLDKAGDAIRQKYRYLELRNREKMSLLKLRHEVMQISRNYLSDEGFYEVETPVLYKSTPEGARDFLVPSRVSQGEFYALPQSPQTLKQLLMIAGTDKYFQIARCFRDEDLRADRQPEFTQIDIEMSFINEEIMRELTEGLATKLWKKYKNQDIGEVPVLSYHEAMDRFGSDKPDLRVEMEIQDLTETLKGCEFKAFSSTIEQGGKVKALALKNELPSRSQTDKWTKLAQSRGAKGLAWIKSEGGKVYQSPVLKFLGQDLVEKMFEETFGSADHKGVLFLVSDTWATACEALGYLRLELAKAFSLTDESVDRFLWVNEFPLFEYNSDDQRWYSIHHPFTEPLEEHKELLIKGGDDLHSTLGEMKSKAYDFVCNGSETAGGSLRIYQPQLQKGVFKALGLTDEEVKAKFGFFIDALQYGTPPHGGIAWGLDRLVMHLAGVDTIRDVIAFPKTAKGTCPMSHAPSEVAIDQLIELGLKVINPQV